MRFSPDHDPTLFSPSEIAEIEMVWQYAAVALSHYRLHDVFSMELDTNNNGTDNDDDSEAPILTLSRHSRQVFPEFFADRTDVVAEAARKDVRCLCWASPRLRRDKQFVSMVLRQHLAKEQRKSNQTLVETSTKITPALSPVLAGTVSHSPKLFATRRNQHFSLPRTLRLPGRQ